jgi:hemolysin-activating ACP:hemolysin acyltransferase
MIISNPASPTAAALHGAANGTAYSADLMAAATPAAPTPITAEQRAQLAHLPLQLGDMLFGAAFARVTSILMRSPHYKHFALADLEWLPGAQAPKPNQVPPLFSGQFAVLDATLEGVALPVPVAVALWANVSPEVDARLSQNLAAPVKLRPDEWRSGDILWLVDVIGDQKAMPSLLAQLTASGAFAGRAAKMRTTGKDGRVVVGTLQGGAAGAPAGGLEV